MSRIVKWNDIALIDETHVVLRKHVDDVEYTEVAVITGRQPTDTGYMSWIDQDDLTPGVYQYKVRNTATGGSNQSETEPVEFVVVDPDSHQICLNLTTNTLDSTLKHTGTTHGTVTHDASGALFNNSWIEYRSTGAGDRAAINLTNTFAISCEFESNPNRSVDAVLLSCHDQDYVYYQLKLTPTGALVFSYRAGFSFPGAINSIELPYVVEDNMLQKLFINCENGTVKYDLSSSTTTHPTIFSGGSNLITLPTAVEHDKLSRFTVGAGANLEYFSGYINNVSVVTGDTLPVCRCDLCAPVMVREDCPEQPSCEQVALHLQPTQMVTQTHKIAGANDTVAGDHFGIRPALDGDTLAIGAFYDDGDRGVDSGSVYMYKLIGDTWTETHKIAGASDTVAGDRFGISCSLDGDTLVVGAYLDDDRGVSSGSVHMYKLIDDTWTETHKIAGASDTVAGDHFGAGPALDGDTLAIGAHFDDDEGAESGSVYMYKLSPTIGRIMDRSGNGHQITVTGDTVVDDTATLFGGGTMNFDGDGDYLTVNQTSTLNLGGNFTMEGWFKINTEQWSDQVEMLITSWKNVSTNTGSEKWQLLRINSQHTTIPGTPIWFQAYTNTGMILVSSNDSMQLGTWYHVAIVADGDVVSLYLNGKFQNSTTGWNNVTYTQLHPMLVGTRHMPRTDINQPYYSDMHV